MSEERYDLKESKKSVRELYPVIEDAHGNVIDGLHRLEIDSNWRRERLEHIKTPTQLILARIVANTHRRTVSTEERSEQIAELANCLENEKVHASEIISTIQSLLGFTRSYILRLAPEKYKRTYTYDESGQAESEPMSHILEETETKPEYIIENEVVEETQTVETILSKLNRHNADEEFITYILKTKAGLSQKEAKRAFNDWMGKTPVTVEHLREAESTERVEKGEKPKKVTSYRKPKQSPTTRCPLCLRDGADRAQIMMNLESPTLSKMSLGEFIKKGLPK